jgi:type VII secretion integral membrane protein EccD
MNQDRGDICRLTVVGPASQVDVSLPTHIPLTDMMPALLHALGPDLADRGLEHSGWIAQRFGGQALNESRTVADLELLDGETVYVRPRTDQIPPLAYDDLIDGVSAGIRKRSGLWRAQTTRFAGMLLCAVWLGAGIAALQVWPDPVRRAGLLGIVALACYVAGFTAAREPGDRILAGILGAGSVVAAVLGTVNAATRWPSPFGGTGLPWLLLCGACAATVAGILVASTVFPRVGWRPITVGLLSVWFLAAVAVLLRTEAGLSWTADAAVMVMATALLREAVPLAAFKLAGLVLPEMPNEPDELQKDIDPRDSTEVLAAAATADRYMTAVYTALGLISGAGMLWLAVGPGWAAPLAAWLAAAGQILLSRTMTSTWHRLAMAGPALAAMACWAVAAAGRDSAAVWALAVCFAMAAICAICARILVRRRLNPLWGQVGDWAHVLAVAALLPVVVWLTGAIDLIMKWV